MLIKKPLLIYLIILKILKTEKIINLTDYESIIEYTEELKKSKNIIKIKDGFKKYPVKKIKCGKKNCKYPIIEMTNYLQGEKNILKLPTILLISGFEGKNLIGLNILVNFIERNKKNTFLLNNFKIIIILAANPYGIKNKKNYEKTDQIEKINPLEDFSYYFNTAGCFNTISSKIINYLFLSNIIYGMINLQKGSFGMGYPFSENLHDNDEVPDLKPFEDIANFFLEKFKRENFKIGKLKDRQGGKGNFLDWAYGASWDFLFFNRKCGEKSFGEFNGYPDQTNRVFGFTYFYGDNFEDDSKDKKNEQIDDNEKDDIPYNNSKLLNKINLLTEKVLDRSNFIIEQFFNFMTPHLKVVEIQKINNSLNLKIKVKGCINIHRLAIIEDVDYKKINEIKNENMESIFSFKINNVNNIVFSNLRLELNCENNWVSFESKIFPESHFLRQKFDPNYVIQYKDFFIQNRNHFDFQIFNIDLHDLKSYDVILDPFYITQIFKEDILEIDFQDFYFLIQKENNGDDLEIIFKNKKETNKDINFDFLKNNYKMKIYNFGDFGCCGPESLGYGKKIENFKIKNEKLKNLLGKGIILSPLEKDNKLQKSIISLKNSKRKGYYMPKTGLTCSNKNKKTYYYLQINYLNKKKLKFNLLTNIKNIDRVELPHNYIIGLYYSQKIENTMFGSVNKYFSIIDKERDVFSENGGKDKIGLNSMLLGTEVKVFNFFNELVFKCKLGVKNLDYEEVYNLMYNYKSRSFTTYNADNSFFSYVLISVIIGFIFIIIIGILCKLKKKKNFDISFERVKIEH